MRLNRVQRGHQRKTCPCATPRHACQHRDEAEADHDGCVLLLGGVRGRCLGLHDLERGRLRRAEHQACSLGVVRPSKKVTAPDGIASSHAARWLADLCQRHGARKIRRHAPNTSHGRLWLAARLWGALLLRSPPPRRPWAASSSAPVVVTHPGILRRYGVLLVSSEESSGRNGLALG